MLELGISQAQAQFTKLLGQEVTIVDKKNKAKKAVILPFDVYKELLQKALDKKDYEKGTFTEFAGLLSKKFKTEDERYNDIVNSGKPE